MISVKDIVKNGNIAYFTHAIAGVLYYKVSAFDGETIDTYQFSVDMNDKEDVGTSTFDAEVKAITLMRYINKAIKNETFYKIV
jgi:thiamine transporter ThiT